MWTPVRGGTVVWNAGNDNVGNGAGLLSSTRSILGPQELVRDNSI